MSDTPIKHILIKEIDSGKPGSTIGIEIGTTVKNVLDSLGRSNGYHLVDPANPDRQFPGPSDLYAAVEDGQVMAITSAIDAGIALEALA